MLPRILVALALILAPALAQAQSQGAPTFKSLTLTGTGSTGDVSGMSVTAGGTTSALATRFPLLAPLASPTFTGTATIPNLTLSGTGFGKPGSLVASPSGSVLLAPGFSASAYGLKGDGTTDNSSALSSLLSDLTSGGQGGFINFPCGTFKLPAGLAVSVASGKHVGVRGGGAGCKKLYVPAANVIVLSPADNSASSAVSDLELVTDDTTGAYTAIWFKSAQVNTPQNSAASVVEHVGVHGSDGLGKSAYWGTGLLQDKVNFVNVLDYTYNGSSALAGIGYLGQGDSSNVGVVANFQQANFAYCAVGVQVGNQFQGLTFGGSNITGCARGIYSPANQTLNQQVSVYGSQFNNGTSDIELASVIHDLHVSGNVFLLGSGAYGVKTVGVIGGEIGGNSFSAAITAGTGTAVSIGTSSNSAEMVSLHDNTCLSIAGCITVASGAKGLAHHNVSWNTTAFLSNASTTFFQTGNIVNGARLTSQAGPLSGVSYADTVSVNNLLGSQTAPTIASGFCTSPSIIVPNGTWSFRVAVGSSCAASSGVLTMPTAANGWSCTVQSGVNGATSLPTVDLSASTATSITIRNYARSNGASANFTSSDVLMVNCLAQ